MKGNYWVFFILLLTIKIHSQNHSKVLFTIDNEPVYTNDFLEAYKKNLKIVSETNSNTVQEYLDLYINFKLKVKEATFLGLDTLPKFKNELQHYKNTLALPFLKDTLIRKQLILEGYNRLQKEIKASHILIAIPPNSMPNDTLLLYNKIAEARSHLMAGANFEEIAKKYSDDPSVNENGGDLGYFTAFQMVYPFENAVYTTKINEISKPFKTNFGYHIVKVNEIRDARGEVEVSHLILSKKVAKVEKRIDSIHKLLITKKATFTEMVQQFSEDRESVAKNGLMSKFGTGSVIPEFEDVAFALKKEGEISKPFLTPFGWHIIQLHKKYPLEGLNTSYNKIEKLVENDERSNIIIKKIVNQLLSEYKITVNEPAHNQFYNNNWKLDSGSFNKTLLLINEKKITQQNFINFLNTLPNTPIEKALELFKEKEVISYFKENLEFTNSEFANLYLEFKESLLLFDLMDILIWQKAANLNDLNSYFNKNKKLKYSTKTLDEMRDVVMSDFQETLEEGLIQNLHSKYKIHINMEEKNRIINFKF